MKKIIKALFTLLLVIAIIFPSAILGGCSKKDDGEIKILCTVFPLYDWARNVVGDTEGVSVQLLVKNGTDIHSYQPSFADTAAIKDSDAVLYVGGVSDAWVEEAMAESTKAIKLSETEGVTLYEVSAHSIAEEHSHNHGQHDNFDEHIWLSVRNAAASVEAICNTLSEIDVENTSAYRENTDAYKQKLTEIDQKMETLSKSINEPLIFADRFPFVYLFEDYSIDYYAAFEGCTTEKDANFDTVIALSKRLDDSKCGRLFTTEAPDKELVDSVLRKSSSNSQTAKLDSMQSLGGADVENSSYLNIMERNVSVLRQIFTKAED